MKNSFLICALLSLSLLSVSRADPFSLTINSGDVSCFGEQVTTGLRVQGNITLETSPDNPNVYSQLRISDESGEEILFMENKPEFFFDITMKKDGVFNLCMFHTGQQRGTYTIDVKLGSQIVDKDAEMFKKDDVKELERLIKRWHRMLKSIQMNLSFIVRKSGDKIEEADQISFLVKFFSFISIVVCIGTAFAQTRFMKMFFKKKKII